MISKISMKLPRRHLIFLKSPLQVSTMHDVHEAGECSNHYQSVEKPLRVIVSQLLGKKAGAEIKNEIIHPSQHPISP